MPITDYSLRSCVAAMAESELLRPFAMAYLMRHHEPAAEPEQVFAEIRGAFSLMADRREDLSAVRVFTPTLDRDGYEAVGSVVETATDDLPFLVDSVRAELEARDLVVRRVVHPIVATVRSPSGALEAVTDSRNAAHRESVMHFELDRRLGDAELTAVEHGLAEVLEAVRVVVADFPQIADKVQQVMAALSSSGAQSDDLAEPAAFLRWLIGGAFTVLGYREHELRAEGPRPIPGSSFGLLARGEPMATCVRGPQVGSEAPGQGPVLHVSKADQLSPVRRRARMDDIRVVLDRDGATIECRLIGLFTRKAYASPAAETPLLGGKLRRILAAEELIDGSHDYEAAVAIFGSFSKDDLFATPWNELGATISALLAMQADQVRVIGGRSDGGRTAALVVALPRRRYSTDLGWKIQRLVVRRFGAGVAVESYLVVSDQFPHARLHFSLHAAEGVLPEPDLTALEAELTELTRSWDDAVETVLAARCGSFRAHELVATWCPRLPDSYKAAIDTAMGAADVERLDELERSGAELVVGLQNTEGGSGPRTRLTLYQRGEKVPLSEILPVLEKLGLQVLDERPARLIDLESDIAVQNFGVRGADGQPLDLADAGPRLADTIVAVRRGETDADWLSKLVLVARLDWRQVAILRAYRVYRQRAGARFGFRYDSEAFACQPAIATKLVRYFEGRHRDGADMAALRAEIVADIDAVQSLDQDRILRDQLALVDATLRTNAYQPGRDALAIKLRSGDVAGIPDPKPHVEVFVHSVAMEGIHLRGEAIARGGLRWSDRLDFRTEVYALMLAQMTKNAIIVPAGAKGGFYLRGRPDGQPTEVATQYRRFISALLDITDNVVAGRVVRPDGLVALDDDDPYLVVAADKGTASLSDTANEVAAERGFWLGDAFASGGSHGYDHKKLGITARGAWESVKRLFREFDQDPERDVLTVAGIGDMGGDVFGNAMLLSRTIRLVAAYDHRHVFLDPEPDPDTSWQERKRLFDLGAAATWADYQRLSPGGGVWPRSVKSIPISTQARQALGVADESLPPDEVIRAILRAPVDLLFNGGIGTVVKASVESHVDAQDRASDTIRVNAAQLRARVVGEGGNLGFTQRARIEAAANGVGISADFIDNSAGVDSSDHEVNLKIVLDTAVRGGSITVRERNSVLEASTADVVAHVLQNSYRQARILSREAATSVTRNYAYDDLMDVLEAEGTLDRDAEALPSKAVLDERQGAGNGLYRPELAVLLAHTKRSLTAALLASDLVDDEWFARDLCDYFPVPVAERFLAEINAHPLRRELVATIVANDVVDSLGPSFVARLSVDLGETAVDVVRAYRIAREVTRSPMRFAAIDALDGAVSPEIKSELLSAVETLVEAVTRWYLRNPTTGPLTPLTEVGRRGFEAVEAIQAADPGELTVAMSDRLEASGVPQRVARAHALAAGLASAPDVLAIATRSGREPCDVAFAFSRLSVALGFDRLEGELDRLPSTHRNQRWALAALRDDARAARRDIVAAALEDAPSMRPSTVVDEFITKHRAGLAQLATRMRSLGGGGAEIAGLVVVIRELRSLAASVAAAVGEGG